MRRLKPTLVHGILHWLGFVVMFVAVIVRTFNFHPDYYVKAKEVAEIQAKLNGGAA